MSGVQSLTTFQIIFFIFVLNMGWGVFNKVLNYTKKKIKNIIDIPNKITNTFKNVGKWFVKLGADPIGALKELPKEYIKLYWNIIKNIINDFDEQTTLKTEILNEYGDLAGPKFKVAGIIFKKLNDLRIPVTDKIKQIIFNFIDEQLK